MVTSKQKALYDVVHRIPHGSVVSYGSVAQMLDIFHGIHISGFFVGKMLSHMSSSDQGVVPWWRVVRQDGYLVAMKLGTRGLLQRDLLRREGVKIVDDSVDMKLYGWHWKGQ